MDKEEKMLRQLLREKGYDVDGLFESDALNEKERKEQLASILADISGETQKPIAPPTKAKNINVSIIQPLWKNEPHPTFLYAFFVFA